VCGDRVRVERIATVSLTPFPAGEGRVGGYPSQVAGTYNNRPSKTNGQSSLPLPPPEGRGVREKRPSVHQRNLEFLADLAGGEVRELEVPGDRDFFAVDRVLEDGILAALPEKDALVVEKVTDEVFALHKSPLRDIL
jgi:hypothetical protein